MMYIYLYTLCITLYVHVHVHCTSTLSGYQNVKDNMDRLLNPSVILKTLIKTETIISTNDC